MTCLQNNFRKVRLKRKTNQESKQKKNKQNNKQHQKRFPTQPIFSQ